MRVKQIKSEDIKPSADLSHPVYKPPSPILSTHSHRGTHVWHIYAAVAEDKYNPC